MSRSARIGSLSDLRRSDPKEEAAKGCSECDQTAHPGAESPVSKKANESRAVSPPITSKEEHTEATEGEKRALKATGSEGKKRVCLICSKPSEEMICGACADKISADALEKKRWEETGKP
jgi:hypothetical protein